jgi:hypothetical protein
MRPGAQKTGAGESRVAALEMTVGDVAKVGEQVRAGPP